MSMAKRGMTADMDMAAGETIDGCVKESGRMIRFGIIGTGKIVQEFLEAAKRVEEFQLQAVYSRSLEKAKKMAGVWGAAEAYDSLGQLAESQMVDAVYVASPNCCHSSQVKLMLEHGKHVLCEKPPVTHAGEWEDLVSLAKRQGVVLLEAMRPAFDPGFQKIEELLPRLGAIRRATFQYSQYSSRYDAMKQGTVLNAFNPELSNAAIMDIGVYCIHALVRLFGKPEALTANSIFLDNGMEAIGTLVVRYPHMLAEIMYSKVTDSAQPSEIQGELGTMQIQSVQIPREITIRFRDGRTERVVIDEPENNMNHEITALIHMIEGRQERGFYQEISQMEMEVLDWGRREAGIRFPSEQE